LKAVLKEVIEADGKIILFIDEIHNLLGLGKSEGAMDAGNLLKVISVSLDSMLGKLGLIFSAASTCSWPAKVRWSDNHRRVSQGIHFALPSAADKGFINAKCNLKS
jgi:hypothetical protein